MNTFQDVFKELNLAQLEIYAEEWATKFSIEFDRIILFKNLNPRRALHEDVMGGSIPGRYLILFELKGSASNALSSFQEMIQRTAKIAFDKMVQATAEEAGILLGDLLLPECVTMFELWRENIFERYDRFLLATGQTAEEYCLTISDPNVETSLKILRGDYFYRVYKNKSDYIQDDWEFRVKDPYKDLPLGVKEENGYFWVLYDSNKKDLSTVVIKREAAEKRFFETINPSIKDKKNVFKRIGKNWIIKYKGKATTLSDHEKIRYIVHLLDNPGVPIFVTDLLDAVKKKNLREKIEQSDAMKFTMSEWENLPKEQLDKKDLSLTNLSIDGLTKEEKEKFEDIGYQILQKQKDAKKNNNQTGEEWIRFKNHMLNEYGIKVSVSVKGIKFTQMRRPGPEVEKVRKSVLNQINNTITDIKREIPLLAQYLNKNIETGKECTYKPDDSNVIDWHITW